ncbi:DUF2950 family protein [Variovorax sp. J22R24]|uniref:DUF2950 family protein n=1 Tax=Variovorax gracilis TaxID=3053502 RepID=UPI00257713F3|nr:DUF2950 family protein [Variovorax sp. J22R24]MDM0109320.1 DUF2950 family protein [Variovorax sp. J22R24]
MKSPDHDRGAYDHVIGNRMRSGLALVAWPVHYGETGAMSFTVSRDGAVYDKDLGPDSEAAGGAMTRFDPDAGWRRIDVTRD